MGCFIRRMRQMCLLVAMLMMCSVSGRGRDNLRDKAKRESLMGDETIKARRQATPPVLCGQRPYLSEHDEGPPIPYLYRYPYNQDIRYGPRSVSHFCTAPWHVIICIGDRPRCGGVVINQYWVLTSAACVHDLDPSTIRLNVGNANYPVPFLSNKWLLVEKIIVHEYYAPRFDHDYDIALLKVDTTSRNQPTPFNRCFQPVCLPILGVVPPNTTTLTITGFAYDMDDSFGVLAKTIAAFTNSDDCFKMYSPSGLRITSRMFCSLPETGYVCAGFEGGPVTYKYGGIRILLGIVSFKTECNTSNTVPIYSNILAYEYWIEYTINMNSSNYNEAVLPSRPGESFDVIYDGNNTLIED